MKTIIKTSILTFIILAMISLINICYAASFSVSSSATTVTRGGTFTITVNGGSVTGRFNLSASSNISLSNNSVWVENGKVSVTATAKSAGSASVKVTAVNVADSSNGEEVTGSKTISVTIKEPETQKPSTSGGSSSSNNSGTTSKPTTTEEKETPKSSDSTLKSLSVIEGAITPEFNKDVREYKLTVPNEIGGANVTAIPTDSKATVSITGNVGLKEGENTVTIVVVAEDGSSSKYLIRVTKLRPQLSLQSLVIKYRNQEGELIETLLNPVFNFQTYEYTLEDLEYWGEKLEIDAIANIEGATIDIQGADALLEGENTVIITVKVPMQVAEGEEIQDEIKTYTIKFNKKQQPVPPTFMGRISNWFNGIFGGVSVWYGENQEQVVLGALGTCVIALFGLSIYIIVDYYKYKDIISKLKDINETDNTNIQIETVGEFNSIENIYNEKQNIREENNKKNKVKGGKRFID